MAWAVDQDYLAKLSESERAWLAQFNDAYYGADFRGASEQDWPTAARRERYNAKNAANADGYAPLAAEHRLDELGELEVASLAAHGGPVFLYVEDPEYRRLLANYRATLSENRQPAKPKDTPAYRKARAELEAFVSRAQQKS